MLYICGVNKLKTITMKKILLSLVVLATAGAVNAQILTANDAAGFSTWTTYDLDGDALTWAASDLTGTTNALAGAGECMISNSFDNTASLPLTPDNALVSPIIDCSGSASVYLRWTTGNPETDASGWYEEKYAVYVLTTADLPGVLGGVFPAPAFETTLTAGEVFFMEEVDITTWAAGNADVYVAFRHYDCTDENWMIMDDVVVSENSSASIEENTVVANVYPNPAADVLNITASNEVSTVSIIGMDGKAISTTDVNGTTTSVNISALNAGVYFYEVVTANGTVRNTFVKK
tara:strand:- start:483 stop:1355 length:873 start_codon:yes stop_codon:yes gene_type:complete